MNYADYEPQEAYCRNCETLLGFFDPHPDADEVTNDAVCNACLATTTCATEGCFVECSVEDHLCDTCYKVQVKGHEAKHDLVSDDIPF